MRQSFPDGLKTGAIVNIKLLKRFQIILANSAHTLLLPAFNLLISLLVIRLASRSLWGEFVTVLILMNLAIHIMHWGSKEYLLREFSRSPKRQGRDWQSVLLSRSMLAALFLLCVIFWPGSAFQKGGLALWGIGALLYKSFDVLVLFHRRFLTALALEVIVIGLIVGIIWWQPASLGVDLLIMLFAISAWLKAVGLLWLFRREITRGENGQFEAVFFMKALPFFLLGFSGMLQSQTDLYCVVWFLTREDAGFYQVFINMMIYLQVIASLILQPFLKNIYRLSQQAIRKISLKLFLLGICMILPSLTAVWALLTYLYQFALNATLLILGGLFVLPIYAYLPIVYQLYKAGGEKQVLWVNIGGIVINLLLNLLLIPRWEVAGALAASAAAQWGMLLVYIFFEKKGTTAHEAHLS